MPQLPKRTQGWSGVGTVHTKSYDCAYCGHRVASVLGWDGGNALIRICNECVHPTYFAEGGEQIPGVAPGAEISNLPVEVGNAYREARDSLAAGAPTASVLMSRKLLMNIAVAQGADENKTFAEYVTFLADKGYVPPGSEGWVDHIRSKGNDATHEIPPATPADAAELITFLEMLLRFIYDFPSRVPGAAP